MSGIWWTPADPDDFDASSVSGQVGIDCILRLYHSATMKTLQSTLQLNEAKLEKFLQYFDRLFNHQQSQQDEQQEEDSTMLIDIQGN